MATQSPQNDADPLSSFASDEGARSSLRILVVEDDIEMASMVRYLLEYEGYDVIELNSGELALELIAAVERGEDAPFDLALLDIMMPYVNGYEVCQEIRRTQRMGYIPIIMITALNSMKDLIRGLDLGADDYLVKPFNSRELLARVRAALRVRDADRAMRLRNWQLAVLNDLNDAIGGSLDRDEVLQAGLSQVLERLNLDHAVAFLRDQGTDDITRVLHRDGNGWLEDWTAPPVDPAGNIDVAVWQERKAFQLAREVIQSGQRRWESSARGWPALSETSEDWWACVPLATRSPMAGRSDLAQPIPGEPDLVSPGEQAGQVLGALLVGAPAEKPMINLNLLTAIGNQIGQALEKSRFYQQARDRGEELAALFDSISDLIYVVDNEYHIAAVNEALRQWLALREREAISDDETRSEYALGHACYATLYERQSPCDGCQMVQSLRTGDHMRWVEHRRRPSGSVEEWEISAYPIQGYKAGPSQAIILARDVTERRMLEASLSQSEKLAALGQLAAGLAHEINNPLTAIVANVQLLLKDTPLRDPHRESLTLMKQASDRAVKVVRNLLDFARQEQYEFQPTDLNASLYAALELVRHQFVIAQVKVVEDLAPDLPLALVSRDHVQGVWLNLLLNARDAVTQAPRAEVEPCVWVGSRLRDDGLLEAWFRDNGVGIPPDQVNHIFEPFFTTKDPGKGTGLGLSTSYHVVRQHGGEILVDSDLGLGTTFAVLLPAMEHENGRQ